MTPLFEAKLLYGCGDLKAAESILAEALRKYEGIADTSMLEILHGLVTALDGDAAEGRPILEKHRNGLYIWDDLPNLALVVGEPDVALQQIEKTPLARNYRWLATNPNARRYLGRPDFRALLARFHAEWESALDLVGDKLPAAPPPLPTPEELLSQIEGVVEAPG
jgi:hypothetical protein